MVGVAVVGGDVRYTCGTQRASRRHRHHLGADRPLLRPGRHRPRRHARLRISRSRPTHRRASGCREALRHRAGRHKVNVDPQSSVIGTVVGILPGAGGSIAGLVSYSEARRSSPHSGALRHRRARRRHRHRSGQQRHRRRRLHPDAGARHSGHAARRDHPRRAAGAGHQDRPDAVHAAGQIVYTFIFGLLIATMLMLPVGLLIGRYAYQSIIAHPEGAAGADAWPS